MNGARSTYMRKGYLLTALAAAVLLAASSGTALAQVTITAPDTVNEGDSATVTVMVEGFIAAATDASNPTAAATASVTVTLTPVTSPAALVGEATDISGNLVLCHE